jgi:Zn-dependent M28 family amino/carboxypeptidase
VRRSAAIAATVAAVALTLGGCGSTAHESQHTTTPSATDYAATLRQRVTTDAMMGHLRALQTIADQHDGNRAVGTAGYTASVDYVVNALRNKGFDVQTPEFEFRQFHADKPAVTVSGAAVDANALEYSLGTPAQGVTGPLVATPVATPLGCTGADYGNLPVAGAVALVERGSCQFSAKEQAAVERGAVALIVADNVDEDRMGGTLGTQTDVKIPVVAVSKADGARLRERPGTVTIDLTANVTTLKANNVIAQTKTGSTQNVVMVGAHLDSVKAGPGINDNGSGVAAVLETALQLGSSPPIQNAVRFGFWGAEELGLVGSDKYLETLDVNALKDIALYLNFDMLGSPNPGYFTYDGDQSTPPGPDQRPPRVPDGSAGIERTLVTYLTSQRRTAEDTSFAGRSDYEGFTQAGIPAGGLFSGAEEKKTAEQVRLWGGQPDQPFDPNYHQKTDTLDRIDRAALGVNGGGAAYAVGLYAQDEGGRDGVPLRDGRARHLVTSP